MEPALDRDEPTPADARALPEPRIVGEYMQQLADLSGAIIQAGASAEQLATERNAALERARAATARAELAETAVAAVRAELDEVLRTPAWRRWLGIRP